MKKIISDLEKIDNFIRRREIEESELPSYTYDSNIYGLEHELAVGGYYWDEDEEWEAKCEQASDYLEDCFDNLELEELNLDMAYKYIDIVSYFGVNEDSKNKFIDYYKAKILEGV